MSGLTGGFAIIYGVSLCAPWRARTPIYKYRKVQAPVDPFIPTALVLSAVLREGVAAERIGLVLLGNSREPKAQHGVLLKPSQSL